MSGIRVLPAVRRACPGELIAAKYDATLTNGTTRVLGGRDVAALNRRGVAATPTGNGDWQTNPDPLVSAMSGYRLSASWPADSTVRGDTTVAPTYGCRRTTWQLATRSQYETKAYIRLGSFVTPFFDSVVVAALEISGGSSTVAILGPGEMKQGAIQVIALGVPGTNGRSGRSGDRGQPCGNGGDGEEGGPGGDGTPGGEVDIIVEAGGDWLADLVSVSNAGGRGGAGGNGGAAGAAGAVTPGTTCSPSPGRPGRRGRDGQNGIPGRPPRVTTVPFALLWVGSPIWANVIDRASLESLMQLTARKIR